ncbi:IS66 family insertion sequence element accessory protein TnpA, partial [Leptospira weilii]
MDWPKEIDAYSQSGLSQPQYCKERGIKYTTYRY